MSFKLSEMNRMATRPVEQVHIACGDLTYFRDWVGRQTGMRAAPPDEIPVPTFAGIEVKVSPLVPHNCVMIQAGHDQRLFWLDDKE